MQPSSFATAESNLESKQLYIRLAFTRCKYSSAALLSVTSLGRGSRASRAWRRFSALTYLNIVASISFIAGESLKLLLTDQRRFYHHPGSQCTSKGVQHRKRHSHFDMFFSFRITILLKAHLQICFAPYTKCIITPISRTVE